MNLCWLLGHKPNVNGLTASMESPWTNCVRLEYVCRCCDARIVESQDANRMTKVAMQVIMEDRERHYKSRIEELESELEQAQKRRR